MYIERILPARGDGGRKKNEWEEIRSEKWEVFKFNVGKFFMMKDTIYIPDYTLIKNLFLFKISTPGIFLSVLDQKYRVYTYLKSLSQILMVFFHIQRV